MSAVSAPERVEALVIGGGVVGCAVLRELARQGLEGVLVEREPDLGEGTSKANSAIVHSGFDARAGTVEAAMLRRAATLWPELVAELAVPFLTLGAVMLARTPEEMERLRTEIAPGAAALGVRTELLDRGPLRGLAPYVTDAAVGALLVPDEAVIDPFWLTRALAATARANGARVELDAGVVGLDVDDRGVDVRLDDGRRFRADQVFDCAGLWADEVARLAGDASFTLRPRKGQFLVSEETFGVERIVLPIPGHMGKGVLVTPIVFGGALLGPTAEDQEDKGDRSTDSRARERILAACAELVPAVAGMVPIRQFAGLRAVPDGGDYVLRPSDAGNRLWIVAGIRSTGISAAPAVAEAVVAQAAARRGWRAARTYRPAPSPALFAEAPGEIVCLCRSVSRGEVEGALGDRSTPPTLDALKRRSGVGFGDCQGNLCGVAVASLIAAARALPVEGVLRHGRGSWVFAAPVAEMRSRVERPVPARVERPVPAWVERGAPWDVAVIGAGLAGIGVALGLLEAAPEEGRAILLVERAARPGGALRAGLEEVGTAHEREAWRRFGVAVAAGRLTLAAPATAIGLLDAADGVAVTIQDAGGSWDAIARRVVLATGGYVQPCEHRPIGGPRPSGTVTGDLVHTALDAGLLPGRIAVLAGDGRYARATAARVEAAGMHIAARVPDGAAIAEVRGERRLEAVRIGDAWVAADTLVLADRLLASAFIARAAGLLDARPGIPIPVDAGGATSVPRVFAVGTCTAPEIDHGSSLAAGLACGRRLAAPAAVP